MVFNLLIVDDDIVAREGLRDYVDWKALGFSVVDTADSAESALDIIKKEKIHVVLTDIEMDKKNGITLIKEASDINENLKCVILSGHGEFEYARSAIKLGVCSYLTKPVDFGELEEVFQKVYKELLYISMEEQEEEESVQENKIESSSSIIIDNIKKYINENYGEAINLNMLAEITYVHPIYLSSLFKEKTGENFIEYLTKIRVERSKALLKDMSLRISDVSRLVGYESPKHYSKLFKEITGETPKDYRNNKVYS